MHRRSRYLTAWWEQVDAARAGVPLAEGWQDGVLDTITAIDALMKDQKRGMIGEPVPPVAIDPAVEARMRSNPRFVADFEAWVRDHLKDGMDGKVRLFDELGKRVQSLIPAFLTRSQSIPAAQLQELKELVSSPSAHKPASPLTPASLEAFKAFRTKQSVSDANIATQHARLHKLSGYIVKKLARQLTSIASANGSIRWMWQVRHGSNTCSLVALSGSGRRGTTLVGVTLSRGQSIYLNVTRWRCLRAR
jgi:hypothetical protein